MAKIRALLVDDEPIARRGLRQQLKSETDIEIIGECSNGREAIDAINRHTPDVVFLDVQMPLVNGFGVVEALEPSNLPAVVFVTAFDEHAIRAFEVNALDYLLKPIDSARFKKTLARVREHLGAPNRTQLHQKLQLLLDEFRPDQPNQFAPRLVIKEAGRVVFVNVDDIIRINAHGNYVQVHTQQARHLLRETMDSIERRLDPQHFVRLRRSDIVRLEQIKELRPLFNGEFAVVLQDGREVTSSRHYHRNLDILLKNR